MTRRSPARLLAPLALVAAAVALYAVVTSGQGTESEQEASPAATQSGGGTKATATPAKKKKTPKTYTVQPGDTPSAIADANGLTTEELLELNPAVDPQALTPGDKLKLER